MASISLKDAQLETHQLTGAILQSCPPPACPMGTDFGTGECSESDQWTQLTSYTCLPHGKVLARERKRGPTEKKSSYQTWKAVVGWDTRPGELLSQLSSSSREKASTIFSSDTLHVGLPRIKSGLNQNILQKNRAISYSKTLIESPLQWRVVPNLNYSPSGGKKITKPYLLNHQRSVPLETVPDHYPVTLEFPFVNPRLSCSGFLRQPRLLPAPRFPHWAGLGAHQSLPTPCPATSRTSSSFPPLTSALLQGTLRPICQSTRPALTNDLISSIFIASIFRQIRSLQMAIIGAIWKLLLLMILPALLPHQSTDVTTK